MRHAAAHRIASMASAMALLLHTGLTRAEVQASLDLRLVQSDGRDSYMDGGFGKLRFDSGDEGLQLGRARLAWRGGIGGNWHATVDVSSWNLHDKNVVDLTEALVEWRPVPQSAWKSNLKFGAFFPPVSLEHRAPGWSNPYTISSSALNTWVGEELRTIGVEYELTHLGIAAGGRVDVGVSAALFGWNDPAGVELALRGFSLNDRQTPLFGRIGTYAFGGREQRVMFSEIDDRPGYYVGGFLRTDSAMELRALHYDNRGDPTAAKPSIDDYAWKSRFDTVGMRQDFDGGTTLIAQWMKGSTHVTSRASMHWDFDTWFALVARQVSRHHRLAVRFDEFGIDQVHGFSPPPWSHEHGKAWTLGWTWSAREHLEIAGEWLRIDSIHSARRALGENPRAVEPGAQLAVKLFL
jgi:hypothetical protein